MPTEADNFDEQLAQAAFEFMDNYNRNMDGFAEAMAEKERKELVRGESQAGLSSISKRRQRDFFLADILDIGIKDDRASMEAPMFSLSKNPDRLPWLWQSRDKTRSVQVFPSHLGRATIWDKDILIYLMSQLVEGINRDREDVKRVVRFTVYDYLLATEKESRIGGRAYDDLQAALDRLAGTRIKTDFAPGGVRFKENFGLIEGWRAIEKSPVDGRMIAVEVTLSEWLFKAIQSLEVLTINRDYFRLRGGLERRLYEICRKHCGRQEEWRIGIDNLFDKSGSRGKINEFRRMLKNIVNRNELPDYQISIDEDRDQLVVTRKELLEAPAA